MNNLFPEHIINAVSDTLLYSLAWGVLLAVASGIIILTTRKASAKTRYNLLIAALTLFAIAVIFNFIKQLLPSHAATGSFTSPFSPIMMKGTDSTDTAPINDYTTITGFVRAYSNTIVLMWSLIVLVRAFQLTTGLQSLHLLKRTRTHSAGAYWDQKVRSLCDQLGIQQVVRIAASGVAKVPMVIGHLKPVILIPIGLLTSLPPESIEVILLHELAHIRRRDWMVNLLISTMEVIFFFNPAVLWISSLIRTERENCCDDIAVRHSGSKTNYIDTLVACQEYQQAAPVYSLAFNGRKKPLLARVRRMISDKNSSLNRAERVMMAASLAVSLAGFAIFNAGCKKQTFASQTFTVMPDHASQVSEKLSGRTINKDSLYSGMDSLTDVAIPDHPGVAYLHSITQSHPSSTASSTNVSVHPSSDFIIYKPNEVSYPTEVTVPNADVLSRLVKLDNNL